MDGIILAAGKNERLRGRVAPYHKPLLVVNGRSLVSSAYSILLRLCDKVILVVAPENALPICQVIKIGLRGRVVVQPSPLGPGEALYRGLCCATSSSVVVLCGDNIVEEESAFKIVNLAEKRSGVQKIFGGRVMTDEHDASRFTRVTTNKLVEGRPGGLVDGKYRVWLGPLVVPRIPTMTELMRAQTTEVGRGEIKISENLDRVPGENHFVEVECYDIGVPDALEENT